MRYDCLIIGAGFSGSLLAAILARQGRSVVLIDRDAHPRFAIGESSTPIADLLLEQMSVRWDLPELGSLARFGRWQQTHPELRCGLKRGFSFFAHSPHQQFETDLTHANQMLVTASPNDHVSDTHWHRADVDMHLATMATRHGATIREQTILKQLQWHRDHWRCEIVSARGNPRDVQEHVKAEFVVDASGRGRGLTNLLALNDWTNQLRTRTSARMAHMVGITRSEEMLMQRGVDTQLHPFRCDDAAVHHLMSDGWLWTLRFLDGTTSVGRVWYPARQTSQLPPADSDDPFDIGGYPPLRELLAAASVIDPPEGPRTSATLQHYAGPIVGEHYALLPSAAVTLDPLLSTGIAMGVAGVWRLADSLLAGGASRQQRLNHYAEALACEIEWLDQLLSTLYRSMTHFELFCGLSMLYFAGAIICEEQLAGRDPCVQAPLSRLWLAGDASYRALGLRYCERVLAMTSDGRPTNDEAANWTDDLRRDLAPWNTAQLLQEGVHPMYRYTGEAKIR